MSTLTKSDITAGYEPIPGYVLKRRLGSGGFGEVWLADAPGGLEKAVKFVFGAVGEKRAAREMKSLERIRSVNHPFLLTLERFECINGQLVIVTELADGSLEDIYREHIDGGAGGIPREALLRYLHDAADGLDYLSDKFRLQHLDVKPGNMLIVGGHVKVGDFGLLKDLGEIDHSMVGGLTPIYAAPEVFDGRPSETSDQYSLAVMYQELLTGVRPFRGRTIAQLATQHVHSAPNLDPLPAMDRPVVAKALEKSPQRRFDSCLEFVEALRAAGGGSAAMAVAPLAEQETSATTAAGTVVNQGTVEDLGSVSVDLEDAAAAAGQRQALVVAIGGTGAECLAALRQRQTQGQQEVAVGLRTLFIDTDAETVERVRDLETDAAGAPFGLQALHTPLRKAGEYRRVDAAKLSSISRRWLYNVPRSGATEGLRPLGRLAMVDHAEPITARLAEAIARVVKACGDNPPRVYLLGSLDGGTASGMVWDLAHVLRDQLDKAAQVEAEITPILVMPSLRGVNKRPLALAETYAALAELCYFQEPGNGYPGDAGAGWSSVPAARSPLRNAYVVTRQSDETSGPAISDIIAEYVWAELTSAKPVIEAARQAEPNQESAIQLPEVRSLGICPLQSELQRELSALVKSLAFHTLKRWVSPGADQKQAADTVANRLMRVAGVEPAMLERTAWATVPADPAERLALLRQLGTLWEQEFAAAGPGETKQRPVAALDAMLRRPELSLREDEQAVQDDVDAISRRLGQAIGQQLEEAVDVDTLIEALQQLLETTASAGERLQLAASRRAEEADAVRAGLHANATTHPPRELLGTVSEPGPVLRYWELRLGVQVDEKMAARLRPLQTPMNDWIERLKQRRRGVEATAKLLTGGTTLRAGNIHEVWKRVDASFAEFRMRLETLARKCLVPEIWFRADYRGAAASAGEASAEQSLSERIHARLEQLVAQFVERFEQQGDAAPSDRAAQFRERVAAIRPPLLDCGGQQRRVLIVGSERERERYQQWVEAAPEQRISIVVAEGMPSTLLHEAQAIPLTRMLCRLQEQLGGDSKIVAKLRSRCDIEWRADAGG
jgi:hypothetical protein